MKAIEVPEAEYNMFIPRDIPNELKNDFFWGINNAILLNESDLSMDLEDFCAAEQVGKPVEIYDSYNTYTDLYIFKKML